MSRMYTAALVLVVVGGMLTVEAHGQYSAIATPFGNAGASFSENIGIGWGYSGRNFFFHNGGAGAAVPPFGGHDPGADASFGFRSGGFSFNLRAGQGSSRTFTSDSATVVVPNGGLGAIFSGQIRPFVTSVVPVVGGSAPAIPFGMGGPTIHPLTERLYRLEAEKALQARTAVQKAAEDAAAPTPAPIPVAPQKDDPPLVLGK